jgi:eukaryotic-like serine/threonine-protein kinase
MPQRFGKYTLLDKIAEGGMAEIFLALEDTPHAGQRFVIIKRIRPEHADDPDFQAFFLSEGRVSLQCAHPNLPQVYELDRIRGVYYLAMELIRGHTLLEYIRSAFSRGGQVSVASIASVGIGVAAALEHAHGLRDVDGSPLGVVHRDVSPQNVLLDACGGVKLIDFGVARSAVQTHRTRTGVVKGKFSYLAPEQVEGKPPDPRADLFSLGVVLYECFTGKPLFRSRNESQTIQNVCSAPIRDLVSVRDDVPRAIADVIHRALERDPDDRFASATEMLLALDGAARRAGLHTSPCRLRDEVRAHCGEPARPERYLRQGATPPAELISPELAARDPDLLHFLRQAGA